MESRNAISKDGLSIQALLLGLEKWFAEVLFSTSTWVAQYLSLLPSRVCRGSGMEAESGGMSTISLLGFETLYPD